MKTIALSLTIFALALTFIRCGTSSKVATISIETSCQDSELEKFAENYRKNFQQNTKLSLSDIHDEIKVKVNQDTDSLAKKIISKWIDNNSNYQFQSSIFTGFLKDYKSNIEKVILNSKKPFPIISSCPDYSPNALVYKFNNCDRKIVFLNEGIAIHCYGIPRSIPLLISPGEIQKQKFSYQNQDEYFVANRIDINRGFSDLLLSNAMDISLDLQALTWHFTSSVYYFIIAHEYGHDYYDHKGAQQSGNINVNETEFDINKITYDWAEELQADYFSAQVIIDIEKKGLMTMPLHHLITWGGEYYYTYLDYYKFVTFLDNLNSFENDVQLIAPKIISYLNLMRQNIEYQNLDSLVELINNRLPRNPKTKDFVNALKSANIEISANSHPPSYVRRAFYRLSVLRNSKKNSLVEGCQNYGDVYWKYFSTFYSSLKGKLEKMR